MKPWRIFGFYALPVALLAALFALFAGLGARLHGGASALTLPDTLPSGIMVQPGAILGGQALRIGEAITPGTSPATTPVGGLQRPVGSFVYARDGATAFMKTGTAASAWGSIASIGASNAGAVLTSRAAALTGIAPSLLTCFHEDFFSLPSVLHNVGSAGGGTATVATGATTIGGVGTFATGAAAAGRVRFFGTGNEIGRPDTNRFYWGERQAVTTTIDAQTAIVTGVADRTTVPSIGLGVCGNQSTAFFVAVYDESSPCGGTKLTTTTAIDVAYHYFEMWSVADGKIHFAIDLVEIVGSPVTMGSPPTAAMAFYIDVLNQATAANRSLDVDYFHLCWSET